MSSNRTFRTRNDDITTLLKLVHDMATSEKLTDLNVINAANRLQQSIDHGLQDYSLHDNTSLPLFPGKKANKPR